MPSSPTTSVSPHDATTHKLKNKHFINQYKLPQNGVCVFQDGAKLLIIAIHFFFVGLLLARF